MQEELVPEALASSCSLNCSSDGVVKRQVSRQTPSPCNMAIEAALHGTWTSAVQWDKFHQLEASSAEDNIGAYQLKSQETCQITEGVETAEQTDLGHEAGCSSSAATVLATAVPIRGFGGAGLQTKQAITSTPSRASGSTSSRRHSGPTRRKLGKVPSRHILTKC